MQKNGLAQPASLSTAPAFEPIRAHERIQLMDALRGFALLGILVVNTWSLSRAEWVPAAEKTDGWLTDLLLVLIDTKFVTVFSLLFGAGFVVQQQRAEAQGVRFGAYYARRLALLFALACLHAYLLWFGDIVRSYALLGFLLLAVRRLSPKATFRLALLFIGVLTPLVFLVNAAFPIRTNPEHVDGLPLATYLYQTFTQGSYPQILRANWLIDPFHNFAQDMPITLVSMFGKILLGVWLARVGFFRNPAAHQPRLRRWLWWGGTLGVSSSVAFWAIKRDLLPMEEPAMIAVVFVVAGGLVLHSLFYVALFVKLYPTWLGSRVLRFLVPVGRMGLTNYFAQTVLAFALFYGTGTVGKVRPVGMLAASLGLFAVQVAYSRWWLARHEFGPVEWVWRRLAYFTPVKTSRPDSQG